MEHIFISVLRQYADGNFNPLSLVPSVIGAAGSAVGAALQNRYIRDNMALQNEYNVAQWNRENEYNSPAAQMARFREAGLNPDLMYNQQSAASSQNPVTDVPAASNPFSAMSGISTSLLSALKLNSEIEVNEAQRDLMRSQVPLNETRVEDIKSQIRSRLVSDGVNEARIGQIMAYTDKLYSDIRLNESNIRFIDLKSIRQEIENMFAPEREQESINKIKADTSLDEAQAKKLNREVYELVQTFSTRLDGLKLQNLTERQRAMAISAEITAMLPEVFNGAAFSEWTSYDEELGWKLKLNPDGSDSNPGAKGFNYGMYFVDRLMSALGKLFHVNLSSFGGVTHSFSETKSISSNTSTIKNIK